MLIDILTNRCWTGTADFATLICRPIIPNLQVMQFLDNITCYTQQRHKFRFFCYPKSDRLSTLLGPLLIGKAHDQA